MFLIQKRHEGPILQENQIHSQLLRISPIQGLTMDGELKILSSEFHVRTNLTALLFGDQKPNCLVRILIFFILRVPPLQFFQEILTFNTKNCVPSTKYGARNTEKKILL
jgi:hypothetical protein